MQLQHFSVFSLSLEWNPAGIECNLSWRNSNNSASSNRLTRKMSDTIITYSIYLLLLLLLSMQKVVPSDNIDIDRFSRKLINL